MSATDLVADHQCITIRDVKDRAILDICSFRDSNLIDIASDNRLKPDARAGSDRNFADNRCIWSHENVSGDFRFRVKKAVESLKYRMNFHKTEINALTITWEFWEKVKISSGRESAWIVSLQAKPHGGRIDYHEQSRASRGGPETTRRRNQQGGSGKGRHG